MDIAYLKRAVLIIEAVLVGGVLYSVLNWIPIVGATMAGAFTGYAVGGGFRRGFRHAIYAGTLGTLIVLYIIVNYALNDLIGDKGVLSLLIGWVFLVWHIINIFFAGLGGGFGAIGKDIREIIPPGMREIFTTTRQNKGVDYILCPACGQGNVSSAKTCIGCGISCHESHPPRART